MAISAIFFILLFPFATHATCTPTPDCADMGYTETSCEGKFVRCPFDTSKLFCAPCDSKFQYTCSGDYIDSGEGNSCDNKYISCTCVAGATFSNGSCICDNSCSVGNIYYSDASCSSCLENNKTPIGVVVKDNEIIMSINFILITWGGYGIDVPNIYYEDSTSAQADYNGQSNTNNIITTLTNETSSTSAGIYCYNYAPSFFSSSENSWYLPAAGELYNYIYNNYSLLKNTFINKLKQSTFQYFFWSSSEYYIYNAWGVNSHNGYTSNGNKNETYYVTCFLKI